MHRRGLASAWLVLGGALLMGVLAPAVTYAARTPNDSIMFYKPGKIVTGTLLKGEFQKEDSFKTGTWTAATASRDGLALYNKNTGKLLTGKFRGGLFVPKETNTIATGYNRIAAGCDTIMLGSAATGSAIVGTLVDGKLRNTQPFNDGFAGPHGVSLVRASCSDLVEWYNGSYSDTGAIANGTFQFECEDPDVAQVDLLVATADSYLAISGSHGEWGTMNSECLEAVNSADSFGQWDVAAGTADSVLLYRKDGLAAGIRLTGGVYHYVGAITGIGKDWTIMAGGR